MNHTRTCLATMLLAVGSLNAQPKLLPTRTQAGAMARKYYTEHLASDTAWHGGNGDEPDALRGTFLPSPGPGLNFGVSVSTAGDVNGDGYADVIVGAYAYSANTGRAYIYFGGPIMDDIPDVTMTGEAIND